MSFIPINFPKQMSKYDTLETYYQRYFDKVAISEHFKNYIKERHGYCPDFLNVYVSNGLKCEPTFKHHIYSMENYYGDGGDNPTILNKAPDWAYETLKDYFKEFYPDLYKIYIGDNQ